MTKLFYRVIGWLLVIIIVATAVPAQAQSSSRRTNWKAEYQLVKEVQLTLMMRTSVGFTATGFPSSLRNFGGGLLPDTSLSLVRGNTFEVDLTIRPHRILFTGLILSDHDVEPVRGIFSGGEYYELRMSKTQLGGIAYIQTGWSNPVPYTPSWLQYRAKAGGIVDFTGQKVTAVTGYGDADPVNEVKLGRWREHRFFFSIEIGLRDPTLFDRGTILLRLSYNRSMPSFSLSGRSGFKFKAGNKNTVAFGLGICI